MQKRHKVTAAERHHQKPPAIAWMLVHPQIHNIFASLGEQQGDAYQVSDDCLAVLGDISSRLSVEDRTLRTFRRAIGFGQHIRRDLVPLLIHVKDDSKTTDATKIIDATIKILVNLTIPVECLLSIEAVSKTDVGRHTIFDINKLLYASKEAFVDSRTIKAVTDHMKFVIERGANLEVEQCDSINNCLLLLRNILHVPEHRMQISNCPLAHTSMQNRILWNLFTQSIDKLLLHLMTFPQKIYWVVTLVQVIALMYKDQHVGTLQNLLSLWFEASPSDSSDDNESNTSPPPPNQASGDSSPTLTSDPTSDSSDSALVGSASNIEEGGENAGSSVKQHVVRSTQNRNKVLLTSHKQRPSDAESSCSSSQLTDPSKSTSTTSDGCISSKKGKEAQNIQSELSDYGYGTQVENQESISTSSNEDETPQQKPIHQKPHMVQKPRNKTRTVVLVQDKKERRRKKLIKRSKINIINMKGLLHHSPTDEDISNILKEFTVDFLLKGYGSLVHDLYNQLLTTTNNNSNQTEIDTSHIFWLVTYFLKFATQLELEYEYVEPVLSFNIISYLTYEGVNLCEQLELNNNQPGTDLKPYLRRMHLVVTAIKEFLQAIDIYKKINHLTKEDQENLTKLQTRIASTKNLKNLFLLLIRQYNSTIQSRQYLQDLVVTNHLLLLFLDNVSVLPDHKKNNSSIVNHLKNFANVEVMHQYGVLLEDFENNGKFINDCIFTMMHHIGGDIDHVSALFQPVILKTFSKIWDSDYEICDDWSDLIEYVIHKFINVPRSLTQTNSSANQREPVTPPPQPNNDLHEDTEQWSEEETDELYWFYVQSRRSENVAESIEKLYLETGNRTRTRKEIIRQLFKENTITQNCYEEFLMREDNFDLEDKEERSRDQEDKNLQEIKQLKQELTKENRSDSLLWLQKILLEVCYCKVATDEEIASGGIFEPVPYCYIKLNQSVPIVPWSTDQNAALSHPPFVSLLRKLGFLLPKDTRKLFARIPHIWTAGYTYNVAQKLGPVRSEMLKFDVNLLKNIKVNEGLSTSSLAQCRHHSRSHPSIPDPKAVAEENPQPPERNHEVPERVQMPLDKSSNHPVDSPEQMLPISDDFEHDSICETASLTSDLTRMYVSDEEENQ